MTRCGLQRHRHRDSLRAVAGLGDDVEVGLGGEDAPHAVADDGVVVGHEDPRLHRRGHRAGTSRRTRVPRPPAPHTGAPVDEQSAFAHSG